MLFAIPAAWAASLDQVQVDGIVDVYVATDFDRPADNERPPLLFHYDRHGEFNVNLALLRARWSADAVRAELGLMAGTFPQANQAQEAPLLRHLYVGSAGARIAPGLWVDAGLFPSHLGAESAIGTENATLTRTLLAENSPYYLAGARATWEAHDALTLGVVVANGWQVAGQPDGPDGIGGGTSLSWAISDAVGLGWNTWIGRERRPDGWRLFNDLYLTVSGERAEASAWVDVGRQAPSTWGGAALLGRVVLAGPVWLGGRVERFSDPDAVVLGTGAHVSGASAHVDVRLHPERAAWWRIEARGLLADRGIFGPGVGGRTRNLGLTSALQVAF